MPSDNDVPSEISEAVLHWVRELTGSRVLGADRLRAHGGPWRLRLDDAPSDVVLKCGAAAEWAELYACEAAALQLAAQRDIAAPRVLGIESHNASVALLLSHLPGTTRIPPSATPHRLHALGRTAAQIHAVQLRPSKKLPLRTRHTSWTDFALWRRWAKRYANTRESERDDVLRAFLAEHPLGGSAAMTGAVPWSTAAAQETLATTTSTPLLDTAGERLLEISPPEEPTVFVHGDLWQGNTLWDGDSCVGVVDWEVAGAGQPGVDLGCIRWDAAMLFGAWAADEITAGWEDASGRPADAVAYGDLVAVLNYPTEMARLVSTLTEQGRPDLDARTLTDRRDAYVETALAGLDR